MRYDNWMMNTLVAGIATVAAAVLGWHMVGFVGACATLGCVYMWLVHE